MTSEHIEEIQQFIRRYGSANGWTGTLGQACTYIHELLCEMYGIPIKLERHPITDEFPHA